MFYSQLVRHPPRSLTVLSEKKEAYQYTTERHLQALWLEQKYFKSLTTSEGTPIEIVSPGIWNSEAGPDFLKAHLRIAGKDLHGDIEIHMRDENWTLHQHHKDSRYNNVIFHLSLWLPKNAKILLTESDRVLIRAYLENHLTIPLARIPSLIDLELYPYKKFVGSGQCAQRLFQGLPKKDISTLFHSAAEYRLLEKYRHLFDHADGSPLFLAGAARVLGYKHNGNAFLELFLWLYWHYRSASEKELLAISLGICGFFDSFYKKKWNVSAYFQSLFDLWEPLASDICYRISLVLHHIRPFNHPIRRMVVLVKMLKDPTIHQLYDHMKQHWDQHAPDCHKISDWNALRDQLSLLLPAYEDPYWAKHYTFEEKAREERLTLLGNQVRQEIIVNVLLPLLYHDIHHETAEGAKERQMFHLFYQTFPLVFNSKTRYLNHRFFGNTLKSDVIDSTLLQQGTFQLHRDFCMHYEASCEGCPFVERYGAIPK